MKRDIAVIIATKTLKILVTLEKLSTISFVSRMTLVWSLKKLRMPFTMKARIWSEMSGLSLTYNVYFGIPSTN